MPELVSSLPVLLLWAAIGYLAGSVPFGIVFARLFGLGDLRAIGSGNIGATNVLRTGNKLAAALTLIFDAGKAGMVVLIARLLVADDAAQLAGLMAFFGHCLPVWLRFQGGKGVATFIGLMLALWWPAGIAVCLTWLAVAAVTRYSSLSALVAAVLSPVWMAVTGYPQGVALGVALAALIIWRHGENIARLRAGTESKIGKKS
ncbi:glycerol-3-phosphate 1-O-acyltransferase PlsY [Shimia ponticola]|uniref:glycerol-3-phosphate 1-O-acyltransferase PlsY n=1 Tax=Shimia ponticola TaxID=2582893 RepID=UPI0011BFD6B2|nr:glycerol-3-phosphate 1-O-acyltransferase PlsY [Shimia ponticola]